MNTSTLHAAVPVDEVVRIHEDEDEDGAVDEVAQTLDLEQNIPLVPLTLLSQDHVQPTVSVSCSYVGTLGADTGLFAV